MTRLYNKKALLYACFYDRSVVTIYAIIYEANI